MRQFVLIGLLIAGLSHAQDIEVVRHAGGTDDFGSFVIGEVRNNSAQPVEYVRIVASFYDTSGTFIDSAFTYAGIDTVNADELAPFQLGSTSIETFDTYELQVEASFADEPRPDAFTVRDARLREDEFGWTLVGQVVNETNTPMERVKIVATATIAGARIVGEDFTYAQLNTIPPGETSPFSIGFTNMLDAPTDYRVWVQGSPAD